MNIASTLKGILLVFFGILIFSNSFIFGQSLKIITWNFENMMSKSIYSKWKSICSLQNWENTKFYSLNTNITYCNAHNGKMFEHNEKAYKTLHNWQSFTEKIEGLKYWNSIYNADIYALQEISDINALHLIFDANEFDLFATDFNLPLNLGFAVSKKLNATVLQSIIKNLALKENNYFVARPGLEITISNSQFTFKLLNIHLKSGCKNFIIDEPEKPTNKDKRNINKIKRNCLILKHQISNLKKWVKKNNKHNVPFVILGDFNRLLEWELNEIYTKNKPIRLIGSDSFDVDSKINSNTKIAYLFSELNSSHLYSNKLFISFPNRKVDFYLDKPRCRYGNNYIIWNYKFTQIFNLDNKTINSNSQDYGDNYYGKNIALPSDHCPVVINFPLS